MRLFLTLVALLPGLLLADNRVVLETSEGPITLLLFTEKAPVSVNNFLTYVDQGFYDGTQFHRVIRNFMIQGGGFDRHGQRKATHDPIRNEADNGLRNQRGTLAMARTSQPHSASSQFFINHKDNEALDHRSKTPQGWGYAVFGKVESGMEVVDRIAGTRTGTQRLSGMLARDVPSEPIIIERAYRLDATADTANEETASQ